MNRESVKTVVRATLLVMDQIAKRTKTQADDWMIAILQSNEERLVDAVMKLITDIQQPPTDELVVAALASVGISV